VLEVLIVDDEPPIRELVTEAVRELGHRATTAADGEEAMDLVRRRSFDLVMCDVRLPGSDGLAVLRRVRREAPSTDVILMSGYGSADEAVTALHEGAVDYLTKPFGVEEVRTRVEELASRRALQRALDGGGPGGAAEDDARSDAVLDGSAPAIARVRELVDAIAPSDATVLVLGESGTGKELVARKLHERSERRAGPFVAINCAAFPGGLLEAELFGHEQGAFTGAVRRRDGRFHAASGGTLFLDEVAELPAAAQAALLRVLQDGVVVRLGANEPEKVDVRIIAATHRDPKKRIAEGLFREDLYFRLQTFTIDLPPLRERLGDLPLLVAETLRRITPAEQPVPGVTARAWAALSSYAWPGNVRELEHALEHGSVIARSRRSDDLDVADLPDDVAVRGTQPRVASAPLNWMRPLAESMREFERECLLRALFLAGGKKQRAAEILGISRKALWKKLVGHGLGGKLPQ